MKEVAFAPADNRDRQQLIDLLGKQLKEQDIHITTARLAATVDGVLDHPHYGFFHVARSASSVIGAAYISYVWSLKHFGKSAWLDELYVDPEYRRSGVGRELMLAAIDKARRDGCHAVDIEVTKGHAFAEHLYSQTFSEVPRTRWEMPLVE
jgi:GNAT superfamily N-acetyltransferase